MVGKRRLIAVVLAAGLLASCGSDDDGGAATTAPSGATTTTGAGSGTTAPSTTAAPNYNPAGVLRIATPQFQNLDLKLDDVTPYASNQHYIFLHYVLGSLLSVDSTGKVVPYLAESFKVDSETTMTVKLRNGLKFHDGTPYTAQIVADHIMKVYKPVETTGAFVRTGLKDISTIDVVDPLTLKFTLKTPTAGTLPVTLSLDAVGVVVAPSSTPEKLIGAGPYKIKEYVANNRLVAEKYAEFYDAKSYLLGGIEWLSIPTAEAAQNALRAGQVDLIATSARDVDAVVGSGSFASVITNTQGTFMMGMCQTSKWFDNPKFREAFDLAINREQISQVVFSGKAEAMSSLFTKDDPRAVPNLVDTNGDQAKAKSLLAEVGYDGTNVPVAVFPGLPIHALVAEVVIGQLQAVGIKSSFVTVEGSDWPKTLTQASGAVIIISNASTGINVVRVPAGSTTPSAFNQCGYANADVVRITDQLARGTLTGQAETQAWKDIQSAIAKDHAFLTLLSQPAAYVYNKDKVQGLKPGVFGVLGTTNAQPYLEGVSIKK